MKRLQLKVITEDGKLKRTYHIEFNENEGSVYEIKIIDKTYIVDKEGNIMKKYKNYQCQKCGEYIGWLGRFMECIFGLIGISLHNCKKRET